MGDLFLGMVPETNKEEKTMPKKILWSFNGILRQLVLWFARNMVRRVPVMDECAHAAGRVEAAGADTDTWAPYSFFTYEVKRNK